MGRCALDFAAAAAAQAPSVITMAEEPHHHLALHNDYVNVYNAEAAPGDSLLLHRHNHDAVAIAIGDQTVTVAIPGKPDAHTKNADGQVRMQVSGYVTRHTMTAKSGTTPWQSNSSCRKPASKIFVLPFFRASLWTVLVVRPPHRLPSASMSPNLRRTRPTF